MARLGRITHINLDRTLGRPRAAVPVTRAPTVSDDTAGLEQRDERQHADG